MTFRVRQIDFLRGVAVILVLFRHHWIGIDSLQKVGWIGVDLFFVLSGFLVSGLLFNEYKRHGDLKPGLFLIRRGFKIYPLFYFSLFLTFILFTLMPEKFPFLAPLNAKQVAVTFISEIIFIQNYYASVWAHHWSLAIEEHFYIATAIVLPLLARFKLFENERILLLFTVFLFALAITMRFLHGDGFSQTHLRFDSLLAGVVISYFYHYKRIELENFYRKYRIFLLALMPVLLSAALVSWLSYFIRTIGFTFIYLGFSILLLEFLLNPRIDETLKKLGRIYTWTAEIGVYSYGIYLFHLYLSQIFTGTEYINKTPAGLTADVVISFLVYFFGSIAIGILMSKFIEIPMLKIRDRFFPRRIKPTEI